MPRVRRRQWLLVAVMVIAPLALGLAWHKASDDPLWPVFRGSLNLCSLREGPLSPVSPDGRFRVHVVQATCAARFPETMLFVTEADAAFNVHEADPNRAVLEIAGDRTLDAAMWIPAAESASGTMTLRLDFLRGSLPNQLHRLENHWRDVPIQVGESKPAPGAERLAY